MENLLKKEKMLYEALASKTRDKDYMISFHDYFSFILNECVSICNHLAEPIVERGKDIEILESLYAEIIQGVTKSIVDIDGFSHAKITQNRNRNVYMSLSGENIILSDKNEDILLINNEHIIYSVGKQDILLNYNQNLLSSVI